MRHINRKATPKVVDGQVQKKNNPERSASYYDTPPPTLTIDRQRPGQGYRHVLKQRDIETFITLLPEWAELSRGLNAIVLAPGERTTAGWHEPGVVHLCAWEEDLWVDYKNDTAFFRDHEPIFRRLGVIMEAAEDGYTLCKFTEAQARAYQLLHILLHELGHHHDRMTTRSKVRASRGEPFAEAYALKHEAVIWERYQEAFGVF
jgi:hypothetical protein